MKSLHPNVYPKDGHWFKETDGSVHRADSWGGVIVRVKKYRLRQGKVPGDVNAEVIEQVCARDPKICIEDGGAERAAAFKTSLKARVLQWLNGKRQEVEKEQPRWVDKGLQEARSDVCFRCPRQVAVKDGCASCAAAVKHLTETIIHGKTYDARLRECGVLGEHLPVSTWLDEPTVQDGDLPGECWRRRS